MPRQSTAGYRAVSSGGSRFTASPRTSMMRSNAARFCQSVSIPGKVFWVQSSCARRAWSATCRSVTLGSCLLIDSQRLVQNFIAKILAQAGGRMQIHLAADDRREVFMPPEELPAGPGGGQQFRQHVHVAARRIEVIAQHRAEQAQLADAARATKLRDLLAVNLDGQFGNAHGNWIIANRRKLKRVRFSFLDAGFYQFNFGGREGVEAEDAAVDFRLPRRAILPARGQTLLHQALNRRTLRRRRGGDGKLDLINTGLQPLSLPTSFFAFH